MNAQGHSRYEDDLAAYLLDALTEPEVREMERHLEGCPRCRERARWLQGSVELLPTSVEQLEPPPELRERLMQIVQQEAPTPATKVAADAEASPARAHRTRGGLGAWLGRLAIPRPAIAALGAALLVAAGLIGYAIGDGAGGSGTTTIQARVAPPGARATLERDGDSGILRVSGLPQRENRIYEVWLARDDDVRPAGLFQVDRAGKGAAAIPRGLDSADRVMVTSERASGSARPTSDPLLIAET